MNRRIFYFQKGFSFFRSAFIIHCCMIGTAFVLFSCSSHFDEKQPETIALWTFDEQQGVYPSCVLSDHSVNDFPLVLGPGGKIVPGKFGNGLQPRSQPQIVLPQSESTVFGLKPVPLSEGRTVEPLNWRNANFAALMTSGENHLRKEVGFKQPTRSKLNLGDFDWNVEFWFFPLDKSDSSGVVFEIGTGPRGENDLITRLSLSADQQFFVLENQPSGAAYRIATKLIPHRWQHLLFTYRAGTNMIEHFIDGRKFCDLQDVILKPLKSGAEDYMSVGRNGLWQCPLPGIIDELRFSTGKFEMPFSEPPGSYSYLYDQSLPQPELKKDKPLLFAGSPATPIDLGTRKFLFIDDALIEESRDLKFTVNPPKKAERVIGDIEGSFRKHLNIIEDEQLLLRLYNAVSDDYLAVRVSEDGIHWRIPELPDGNYRHHTNIVIHDKTGMGEVFIDLNAASGEKWKYLSGFHSRGIFLYTSADGYHFQRKRTAVLPFWAGSQSNIFYDAQQGKYIAYHRADFARGAGMATQREFVMTETTNLIRPWPFKPSTQQAGREEAKKRRIKDLLPFYLDNGLLTPGGFAFEYPNIFRPDENFDPVDTDVYVPKATKYPWAPDVYLAFPVIYFHYKRSSPLTRSILWHERYKRGSGPLETQLAVSRDAVHWKRYARPAYVGIGTHDNRDVKTAYIAQGMVRRGNEIWQYYFGETQYHSAHVSDPAGRGVYRLVQRLDGFVSLDSPYGREAYLITKPVVFSGNRLTLNIDTDAAGYAQVGFLDSDKKPLADFSVDDCVYINGDFIDTEVEWIKDTADLDRQENSTGEIKTHKDVSPLAGQVVHLIFRMRGSKLYALQFMDK